MVILELGHWGEVRIGCGKVVKGPASLNDLIESMMSKYASPSVGDPDYRVAEELVKIYGGRIIEHRLPPQPPGSIY